MKRLVMLSILGTAAACGGDADVGSPPATTVLDSAGIEIVLNPQHAPDTTSWSVDVEPTLVIGDDESLGADYLFGRVVGAARLSDGRVVVADQQATRVLMYDSVGSFVGQIGRRGSGPGEYDGVGALLKPAGDTVVVTSPYSGRPGQVFGPTGAFVRAVRGTYQESGRNATASTMGLFADGTILAAARLGDSVAETPANVWTTLQSTFRIMRLDAAGNVLTELGTHPSVRWMRYSRVSDLSESGFRYQGWGYLPQPQWAARGARAYLADGIRFEIRVYDADTGLARLIRKDHPAVVIPRSWADTMWDQAVESARTVTEGSWIAQIDRPPVAEHAPALDRMLLDDLGNIWVRTNPPHDPAAPIWYVFDGGGVLRRSLRMEIDPEHIGENHVVTILRDEHFAESVAVFPLRKR